MGTRGSKLALAQAATVSRMLATVFERVEIVTIKTSGDKGDRDRLGAFVREIQDALLEGRVDIGLHCLKDLPTQQVPGLLMAAYLERDDPLDAFLSRSSWRTLPDGAVVGTGSLRRSAQLAAQRPDLRFKPLVGNVDTRLRKLMDGEYEAIVLAVAGLNRLELTQDWQNSPYASIHVEKLGPEIMLPAAGQAILALECVDSKQHLTENLLQFDHASTRREAIAERAFLRAFGGGCSLPVAALAKCSTETITLTGLVSSPDGKTVLRNSLDGTNAAAVGESLAKQMIVLGALDLFERLPIFGGSGY